MSFRNISLLLWEEIMTPSIRFLAELIHDVYGFPLEPVEDSAMISSKGLDSLPNKDVENMAKDEVKTMLEERTMLPSHSQESRHVEAKKSVVDNFGRDPEGVEEVATLKIVGKEITGVTGMGGQSTGKETNPISHLRLQSLVEVGVGERNAQTFKKGVGSAATADGTDMGVMKDKNDATITEDQDRPFESPTREGIPNSKANGGGRGDAVESNVEESDGDSIDRNERHGVQSCTNIVSRGRRRSLANLVEKECKLKVRCQMEGDAAIEDLETLSAPSTKRQVTKAS